MLYEVITSHFYLYGNFNFFCNDACNLNLLFDYPGDLHLLAQTLWIALNFV